MQITELYYSQTPSFQKTAVLGVIYYNLEKAYYIPTPSFFYKQLFYLKQSEGFKI